MPLPDMDTGVGHSFGLEVDGIEIARVSEGTGLKMERSVVEMKENGPDGTVVVRELPGRWKSPQVTLTRGLITSDTTFEDWVKEAQVGKGDGLRRSGAISVFDREGALIRKYLLTNVWPKSLEVIASEAGGTPTISERLVLVCERLESVAG